MNARINLLKHNVLTNVCVSDTSRSCLLKMSRGTAPLTEEIEKQKRREKLMKIRGEKRNNACCVNNNNNSASDTSSSNNKCSI